MRFSLEYSITDEEGVTWGNVIHGLTQVEVNHAITAWSNMLESDHVKVRVTPHVQIVKH